MIHLDEVAQKAKSLFPEISELYYTSKRFDQPSKEVNMSIIQGEFELILEILFKIEAVLKRHSEFYEKNSEIADLMLADIQESTSNLLLETKKSAHILEEFMENNYFRLGNLRATYALNNLIELPIIKDVSKNDSSILKKTNFKEIKDQERIMEINPYKDIDIDWDHPIYCNSRYNSVSVGVIIWKGKLICNGTEVAVKRYKSQYEKKVIKLEKKGRILQKLSNNNNSGHFLNYYGMYKETMLEDNETFYNLYLVTELCEDSLMDDISRRELNQEYYISDISYFKIVFELLEAFAELESLNIYQRDINPHNIWFSKNKQIKIASHSCFKIIDDLEEDNLGEKPYHVQEIEAYTAPEIQFALDRVNRYPKTPKIKYSLSKASVYSLGLIFLQLYCLSPINDINRCTHQDYLNNLLDQFQPENISKMLKGMLAIQPWKRFSFKRAYREFKDTMI